MNYQNYYYKAEKWEIQVIPNNTLHPEFQILFNAALSPLEKRKVCQKLCALLKLYETSDVTAIVFYRIIITSDRKAQEQMNKLWRQFMGDAVFCEA